MSAQIWIAVALLSIAGCARPTLPYTPDPQPAGARISAAYSVLVDRLRIEIDTDGRRLEQAWIVKRDGTSVSAIGIENPPMMDSPGPSVGIGIGGGTWRGGVGTGVSVGIPFGSSPSPGTGTTVVTFPLAEAGPAPWAVYVKVAGIPAVTIAVGGAPPGR